MFRFVETVLVVLTVAFMAFAGYISYRSHKDNKDTDEVVITESVKPEIAPKIKIVVADGQPIILYYLLPHEFFRLQQWFAGAWSGDPERMLYRIREAGKNHDDIYLRLDSKKSFEALDFVRGATDFIAPPTTR